MWQSTSHSTGDGNSGGDHALHHRRNRAVDLDIPGTSRANGVHEDDCHYPFATAVLTFWSQLTVTENPKQELNRARRRALTHRGSGLGAAGVLALGGAGALLAAFAGTAGAAATIVVDSGADGVANSANCTDGTPGNCTLRDAAALAVDGDTINFAADVSLVTLTGEDIDFAAVNIIGPGSGLVAVNASGVTDGQAFYFNEGSVGDVIISGITLTGNRIYAFPSGVLTLDDVSITGSSAEYGGALYHGSADLVIVNSNFDSNIATERGGAIYAYGSGSVTISGSSFTNNQATARGGAIYVSSNVTNFTMTNSSISSNSARSGGGAQLGNYGTAEFSGTAIFNNSAQEGGGIVKFGGSGSSSALTLNNSTMTGNSASSFGGAIYLYGNTDFIANQSTITGNNSSNGGAIAVSSSEPVLTLSGTILAGNASTPVLASNMSTAAIGGYDIVSFGGAMNLNASNSILGDIDPDFSIVGSNNINTTNPMVGALASNGGRTMTMALLPGSPAIDAGPNPVATFFGNTSDQRGAPWVRIYNGIADIGAFEVQPAPNPAPNPDNQVIPAFTG